MTTPTHHVRPAPRWMARLVSSTHAGVALACAISAAIGAGLATAIAHGFAYGPGTAPEAMAFVAPGIASAALAAAVLTDRRSRSAMPPPMLPIDTVVPPLPVARRETGIAGRGSVLSTGAQDEPGLAAARERTRLLRALDDISQALVLTSANGTIRYANTAFERVAGVKGDGGANVRTLRDRVQDAAAFDAMTAAVARGLTWHGELRCRHHDGAECIWAVEVMPVRDENGHITDFFAVGEEISSRRLLEAQFRQAQKMEAVGRLAGAVAHDFNNMLTVMLGHANLVLSSGSVDADTRESAEAIRDAGERASRLTRQLLTFSREKPVVSQRVDVNDIVRNIEPMVRSLVGEDISVVVAPSPGAAPVVADASQIEQIVMNLVVNARDAMPQGGTLTIETLNARFRAPHVIRQGVLEPGEYVLLAVSDTGHGIERAVQERIFEPFYTTKGTDKGTGLGLSTVYGIATRHGGQVEVYSEPGEGSTFKVYLPWADQRSAAAASEREEKAAGGTETVLVVEDEDAVRELLRRSLQQRGYTVIESRNGDEALLFSQRYAGEIHVLVTDMIMPRMNGVEVAEAIARQRPGIRTLFMSGYTDHSVLQHAPLDERAFIRKPFSMESAVARVRQAIDQPARPRALKGGEL